MEFLRSCMSNVQPVFVETTSLYTYAVFEKPTVNKDRHAETEHPITQQELDDTRGSGRLVTIIREDARHLMWVFNVTSTEPNYSPSASWSTVSNGQVDAKAITNALKNTYAEPTSEEARRFLQALSQHFQRALDQVGVASPVDTFTWIISSRDQAYTENDVNHSPPLSLDENALVSLSLKVASSGVIVCLTEVNQTSANILALDVSLGPDSDMTAWNEAQVVLAPIGLTALVHGVRRFKDHTSWRSQAWTWFRSHFPFFPVSELDVPVHWAIVKPNSSLLSDASLSESSSLIAWPVSFCIQSRESHNIPCDGLETTSTADWKDFDFQDSVKMAEQWFLAAGDREKQIQVAQQNIGVVTMDVPETVSPAVDVSASPLNTRNPEPAGASMVYPTPPDGILPANAPTSSTMNNLDLPADEDVQMSSDQPSRQASVDKDTDEDLVDHDNLFGDGEEGIFGNPDLTDADFSFFDEAAAARKTASRQRSPDKLPKLGLPPEAHLHHRSIGAELDSNVTAKPATTLAENASATDDRDRPSGDSSQLNAPKKVNLNLDLMTVPKVPSRGGVSTPPLSPVLVKDALFSEELEDKASYEDSNGRHFAPLTFKSNAAVTNSKYANGGKFAARRDSEAQLKPVSKRRISLRDFLDQYQGKTQPYSEKRPRIIGLSRNPPGRHDSDDSDTESSILTEAHATPSAPVNIPDKSIRTTQNGVPQSTRDSLVVPAFDSLAETVRDWLKVRTSTSTLDDCSEHPASGTKKSGAINKSREPRKTWWDLFDVDSQDLIVIAQHVSDTSMVSDFDSDYSGMEAIPVLFAAREQCASSLAVVSDAKTLSLAPLAAMSAGAATSVQTDTSNKNAPRPNPRRSTSVMGSSVFGQQLSPISAPFVRLQRAGSPWELLSSALNFWETLSLEPAHGSKDMSAELIMIGSEDFRDSCMSVFDDLKYTYEACKFGRISIGSKIHRKVQRPAAPSPGKDDEPIEFVLRTMRDACVDLATKLNQRVRQGSIKPVVICIFNPFRGTSMLKYVCACFRSLQKQIHAAVGAITLQIISHDAVTSQGRAFSSKSDAYLRLCSSIYDRSGPQKPQAQEGPWKLFCAPSVALVNPIPRRVNFTLNEEPPINLLVEAQLLHVAYAISADGRWLTAAWTDYTGNQQLNRAFCLVKADRDEVLEAVRNFTVSLMTSSATWRLIVAFAGHSTPTERGLWLNLAAPHVAVAIVDVCTAPSIQIYPQPDPLDTTKPVPTTPAIPQTASLTPTSTPQAFSTVSPDNHPPTPSSTEHQAPTSAAIEAPSTEPDAHLLDTRDESYALVLPFSATRSPPTSTPSTSPVASTKRPLASGVLLKRGDGTIGKPMPVLGVDVMDLTGPKPPLGQLGNWMMPRQPEYVLREVLAWYRGLALLGKIRHVKGCERGEVPWHVGVVVQSGRCLEGFFD